jgi:hypothetical protein
MLPDDLAHAERIKARHAVFRATRLIALCLSRSGHLSGIIVASNRRSAA